MKSPYKIGTIRDEIFDYLKFRAKNEYRLPVCDKLMPAHSAPMEFIVRRLEVMGFKRLDYTREIRRTLEQLRIEYGFVIQRHEVKVKRNGKICTVVCHELREPS